MFETEILAAQMTSRVRQNYTGHGLEIPEEFLADITEGCSRGFTAAFFQARGTGHGFGKARETGAGIYGVEVGVMVSAGCAYMVQKSGSESQHLRHLLEGLYRPFVDALAGVTVTSASGFGGRANIITGLTHGLIVHLIISNISAGARSKLMSSLSGKILVDSIANGFQAGFRQAYCGVIPCDGPQTGGLVVKFS